MKKAYRVLAYVVAVGVVVQAASVVWAISGMFHWIAGGGVVDQAVVESEGQPFPEALGFAVHGINGSFVIPIAALLLLVSSFLVHARGAIRWAVIVLVLTALQAELGFASHDIPISGAIHGLNALALFTTALITARRRLVPRTGPRNGPQDRSSDADTPATMP